MQALKSAIISILPGSKLLTVQEFAAQHTDRSDKTVYRWIDKEGMPHVVKIIGGKPNKLIYAPAALRWMEQKKYLMSDRSHTIIDQVRTWRENHKLSFNLIVLNTITLLATAGLVAFGWMPDRVELNHLLLSYEALTTEMYQTRQDNAMLVGKFEFYAPGVDATELLATLSDLNPNVESPTFGLKEQIDIVGARAREDATAIREYELRLDATPRGNPLDGDMAIISAYGMRTNPFSRFLWEFHTGIDLGADVGDPVYATAAGEVHVARHIGRAGNLVIIKHGFGYRTYYAHLSVFAAKEGDRVARGNVVGYVGTTGRTTGPHLHYEVRLHTASVDPIDYLPSEGR